MLIQIFEPMAMALRAGAYIFHLTDKTTPSIILQPPIFTIESIASNARRHASLGQNFFFFTSLLMIGGIRHGHPGSTGDVHALYCCDAWELGSENAPGE